MAQDRHELVENVRVMRELGVIVWGDITLGPAPIVPHAEEKKKQQDPLASSREYYENLLNRRFNDDELSRLP